MSATLAVQDEEPALREYFGVLSRRRRVVFAFMAVVIAAAVGSSLLQPKRYQATARILIQPRESTEQILGASAPVVIDRKRIIDTEVGVMGSENVRALVESRFGADAPKATVAPVEGTDLIAVSVTSTDPELAREVANATANDYAAYRSLTRRGDLQGGVDALRAELVTLTQQINDLQSQIDANPGSDGAVTLRAQQDAARARYALVKSQADNLAITSSLSTGEANLVSPATAPIPVVSPNLLRSIILAVLAGGVLSVGLAFAVDLADDRLDVKEDLERSLPGRPVLGLVPAGESQKARGEGRVAAIDDPEGSMAQAYRSMRTSLQFMAREHGLRSIQVTSSLPGEGKTTTAVNLATMFARAGATTVLVDADLRRPQVHRLLNLKNDTGLASVLLGETKLNGVLQMVKNVPGLYTITAGPLVGFPAELMQSPRTARVIDSLTVEADIVIFDSPPVLAVGDPLALSSMVDAVLVVSSVTGASRRQLKRSVELLDQAGATVCGTVLNNVRDDNAAVYAAYQAGARRRSVAERFFRPGTT